MQKAAHAVREAGIPVLIVTGGGSPTFDAVGEVSAEITDGRHVIVRSPNHVVQLMAAEAFNETAANFIQMAERPGPAVSFPVSGGMVAIHKVLARIVNVSRVSRSLQPTAARAAPPARGGALR